MKEKKLLYIALGVIIAVQLFSMFRSNSEVKELRSMVTEMREEYNNKADSLIHLANDTSKYKAIHNETKILINSVDGMDTSTIDSIFTVASRAIKE